MSADSDVAVRATGPYGTGRVHAILWPALLVLAGVAAAAEPHMPGLLRDRLTHTPSFGEILVSATGYWVLTTLLMMVAGAVAVFLGQRRVPGSAIALAAVLVAGSALIEVVGMAVRNFLETFGDAPDPEAFYALSSALLAGAWLTMRGWRPPALLVCPLAGVVSWLTIPSVNSDLSGQVSDMFGNLAMFATIVIAYTLSVLAVSVATLAALMWRRLRPTAPLRSF